MYFGRKNCRVDLPELCVTSEHIDSGTGGKEFHNPLAPNSSLLPIYTPTISLVKPSVATQSTVYYLSSLPMTTSHNIEVLIYPIGDKLRLKASCQGNFRWWLKEQGLPSADALRQGSNNQLDLGFSLGFDNS